MFYFWRESTAALVPGFLCQSGRRRPKKRLHLKFPTTATATGTPKTQKVYLSKTTTLHVHQFVHHAFCTFRSRPCTTTTWNDQILSWLKNGNSKAINFSISLTTQKRFPLFSSNPTFLFSSTAVWLRIRAKKFQGTLNLFSATFSLVTPLSDRKDPLGGTMRILSEGILPSTSHTLS